MALALWQALTEALDTAFGVSDAVHVSSRENAKRPVAIATAGFVALLGLGRLFNSTETMACAVLPPAFVAIWAARRAWLHPAGRKPALAAALCLASLAGLLYALPFLALNAQLPGALGADLILGSVVTAILAGLLAGLARIRDEW